MTEIENVLRLEDIVSECVHDRNDGLRHRVLNHSSNTVKVVSQRDYLASHYVESTVIVMEDGTYGVCWYMKGPVSSEVSDVIIITEEEIPQFIKNNIDSFILEFL